MCFSIVKHISGHSEKVDKARLLSPLHCGSPPFTMRDEHPRSKKRWAIARRDKLT